MAKQTNPAAAAVALFVLCEIIAHISANNDDFTNRSTVVRSSQLPVLLKDDNLRWSSKMISSLQTVGAMGGSTNDVLPKDSGEGTRSQLNGDAVAAVVNASALWSKYFSQSGYWGPPVEDTLRERIDPFWLQFEPPSATAHYVIGIIFLIMTLFGLGGNLLVILMFCKFKSLRTPANYLVINLAVADFLIMLDCPLFVYNSYHQGPATGNLMCTVYALLGALGGTGAIVTLTMISIDRYNVVVYPLNPNRSTTRLKVILMIVFIWIYAFTFAGIPMLDIGLSRYTPEGYLTACSFDYLDRSWNARVFMFLYFIFAWVVPFLSITFCYVAILRVVIGSRSIQSSKNKNKTEIKLAGVVIGIIGLWFIAWTPYAVVAMMGVFGYESMLTPLGSMVPGLFAKVASCIDPYFYAMNHPRYRQELRRMFGNSRDINSQFQTSRYTRGTSRMADSDGGHSERVQLGPSTAADDTSLSVSIDLTESRTNNNH
ncbi:opsin, ultraviolet-sensitive [Topomyia yanbarensis]|uniref:opsin, ultraviolet-sensitive n=1 Tax=Topomyia yanbarensis TaxID=2498891 RepID=UPI00273CE8B2|nr:opsin, ultraviolet-sensitive [Topomyia yanbarensis]XP_058830884.1 opsin, ultraviolet-sensitive [Topomyia yanbarensis]XP_058830885.1 opsin, ultraviolet-sensitive [Topomyia yanbarensis]